jgi:hypothetical protein
MKAPQGRYLMFYVINASIMEMGSSLARGVEKMFFVRARRFGVHADLAGWTSDSAPVCVTAAILKLYCWS